MTSKQEEAIELTIKACRFFGASWTTTYKIAAAMAEDFEHEELAQYAGT